MPHYCENAVFLKLLKSERTKKNLDQISRILILISENVLNIPTFINYTQDRKNEMKSEAIYHMYKCINNFNTDLDNPLAYFTQVCKNAFLQIINKYKKLKNSTISLTFIENIDNCDNSDLLKGFKEITMGFNNE